jgi:hypothetical protein
VTVATATGLAATVDVAHESGSIRIGPRADAADLRVTMGEPLRLAILVGRAPSNVSAALAVALGANADLVLTLGTAGAASVIDRASALREARPNAVLAVADKGDTEGMVELVEALRLACAGGSETPLLLVSADDKARARIGASAGALRTEAIPAPTTRSGREAIVTRLRALRRGGGDIVLRDEAIEAAARSLARATGRSALVVDVSGESTSLALVQPDGSLTAAHSRLGVGAGADRIVARSGLDRVRRWIPRPIDAPALLERVFNRARWPDAVAPSVLTLALEMSLAREALAHLLRDAERAGLDRAALGNARWIVATGQLARFPRAAQTALVVVDALLPEGTKLISRERPDALVVAGAIATRSVTDVAGMTEDLALVTTLWPKRATSLTVTDDTGATLEKIARGAFFLMPTTGAVQLAFSASTALEAAGPLALGVIVDARGRPLELPPRDAERLPTIARWYSAVACLPIDEGTL